MGRLLVSLVLVALAACGDIPADPDDTTRRIVAERRLRVGVDMHDAYARALTAEIARDTGARADIRVAPLEPLLSQLERGEVDLVVARFVHPSPWKRQVTLAPPLATTGQGKARLDVRAAMKNGENRWVMLVERASRRIAAR